jgi:MFS family permease
MLAAAPALVTLAVSSDLRGRTLGLFQMGAAIGFALGPLLGGVLVDLSSWRAVYLFRFFPALFLILLAVRQPIFTVKHSVPASIFDLPGILTLAGSVSGLLLALNRSRDLGWTSPLVLLLLLGSGGCFGGFLAVETRVSTPLIDLSLFRRTAFCLG